MLILEAFQIAAQLHAGQVDAAGRPYIEHLVRVFLRTLAGGGDRDQQIASLLHDAIEDGKTTAAKLLELGVPQGSVDLVVILDRGSRTYLQYIQDVKMFPRAVLIKLADLEDNSDPARLALLPPATAARLSAKYAAAFEELSSSESAAPIARMTS